MNELEQRALLLIAEKRKNMCISIGSFTDFLRPEWGRIDIKPITDRLTLKTGLYAHMLGCKVWVSELMAPHNISYSDLDIFDASETEKWSPQMPIEDTVEYNRIANIKIFM